MLGTAHVKQVWNLMMLCGFKEKTHPTGLGVYIFTVDVVYAHGYFNNLLTPTG